VTLSIKNTAGALYKSQIKGENRYCLWLRNSNVFRRRRKQSSDGAALTSAGRLFHARDAATAGKLGLPKSTDVWLTLRASVRQRTEGVSRFLSTQGIRSKQFFLTQQTLAFSAIAGLLVFIATSLSDDEIKIFIPSAVRDPEGVLRSTCHVVRIQRLMSCRVTASSASMSTSHVC